MLAYKFSNKSYYKVSKRLLLYFYRKKNRYPILGFALSPSIMIAVKKSSTFLANRDFDKKIFEIILFYLYLQILMLTVLVL